MLNFNYIEPGLLGIQLNAMLCVSDLKTIDSQCPITNTQSNLRAVL